MLPIVQADKAVREARQSDQALLTLPQRARAPTVIEGVNHHRGVAGVRHRENLAQFRNAAYFGLAE
jgi:hypothetical protein